MQSFPLDGCRRLSGYIIQYHGDILSAGCLDLLNRAVRRASMEKSDPGIADLAVMKSDVTTARIAIA